MICKEVSQSNSEAGAVSQSYIAAICFAVNIREGSPKQFQTHLSNVNYQNPEPASILHSIEGPLPELWGEYNGYKWYWQ